VSTSASDLCVKLMYWMKDKYHKEKQKSSLSR